METGMSREQLEELVRIFVSWVGRKTHRCRSTCVTG